MQNAIVRDSGGSSMCETDISPWQMGKLLLRWFHLYQVMCAFALLSNVFFFVLRMEELDRHFVHDFLLIHVLERIAEYLKCSLLNHQQLGSLQRKLLKSGTCSSPKAAAKALFSFFFCTARWCNWCIHEAAGFDWHYCRVDRFYLLYHLVASSEVFMIPHVLPCFVGMFRKLNQQKHVRLTMKVVKGQWNWAMCCTLKDWWRNHIVRRFGFCWKTIAMFLRLLPAERRPYVWKIWELQCFGFQLTNWGQTSQQYGLSLQCQLVWQFTLAWYTFVVAEWINGKRPRPWCCGSFGMPAIAIAWWLITSRGLKWMRPSQ